MKIKYTPFQTNETKLNNTGDVYYITFPALDKYPELFNAFSTRLGGISCGMFSSMNLGRMEKDSYENVKQNYEIFCNATGISAESIVISDQQHTDNIKILSAQDRGKGLYFPRDYEAIDGFITNENNIALCLLFADCVPVYIYDPAAGAIALVHSGWKGTAANISSKAIKMMTDHYSSKPEDMVAVIGPSICQDCYEVSEDLYEAFSKTFSDNDLNSVFFRKDQVPVKYQLDLWKANRIILEKAGLDPSNIHTTDLCTCCNSELLFSHRATAGKRGNLAAVLMLR